MRITVRWQCRLSNEPQLESHARYSNSCNRLAKRAMVRLSYDNAFRWKKKKSIRNFLEEKQKHLWENILMVKIKIGPVIVDKEVPEMFVNIIIGPRSKRRTLRWPWNHVTPSISSKIHTRGAVSLSVLAINNSCQFLSLKFAKRVSKIITQKKKVKNKKKIDPLRFERPNVNQRGLCAIFSLAPAVNNFAVNNFIFSFPNKKKIWDFIFKLQRGNFFFK